MNIPKTAVGAMTIVMAVSVCSAIEKAGDNPHLWQPRVKQVAVFKNGLGFFLAEDEVALRDGWCVSSAVPPAAFGTLAVFAHGEKQLVDIVGSGKGEIVEFDGRDAPDTDAARRERLGACKGLGVQLTFSRENKDLSAAGLLRSVGPEYVILENEANTLAVPLAAVSRLQMLELPIRVHVSAEGGAPPEKATLSMAYLRKGITWIPEYTLKLLDDDTAELTLRGTLVNEAEDLVHADVSFVVGVPHFVHTDYLAPVAVGQVIRTIGAAVAPRQLQTQIMNRAAVVGNLRTANQFGLVDQPVPRGGNLASALGNLPRIDSVGGTDYTVYTRKDLTLRVGEKAIVTLMVRKIKFSHVYRWATPGRMEHLLVLNNSTDTAWTTGPCLVISAGNPLSEDLLKYVPRGGSGEIPVTTAINVAHEQTETELDRKLKAYAPSHDNFLDLVTVQGKIQFKNFEKRPTTIVVTVPVPGKPGEATDGGEARIDTTELRLTQRHGSFRWQIVLKPGEARTLTYTYERYVPSR